MVKNGVDGSSAPERAKQRAERVLADLIDNMLSLDGGMQCTRLDHVASAATGPPIPGLRTGVACR